MADNVGYTPGSGATVAADDIGGVLYQRVKPAIGADGSATDISDANPMPIAAYGELVEAIEALRMTCHSILRTMPQLNNQLQVKISADAVAAISNVTTVSSVTTVTNVSQLGTIDAFNVATGIMRIAADNLRQNITVT